MTVLVTGAAGFIGRHLVDLLRNRGEKVVCWDMERPADGGAMYVAGDLAGSVDVVCSTIKTIAPDVVYHLVGRITGDVADVWRANVMGTVNLLEAVKCEAPSARVVVVGSAAEYGRPVDDRSFCETTACRPRGPYGTSKHAAVLAALDRAGDVDVVVARPFNIVGAGMGEHLAGGQMVARFRDALSSGAHVVACHGADLRRDFLAVQDVASALVAIAEHGKRGEIYNVCSGQALSFKTLFGWLSEASGLGVENHPASDAAIPLVVGDKTKLERDTWWTPAVPLRDALLQDRKSVV